MLASENFDGPHLWHNGRTPRKMLKMASFLTRPTPARQDAPCPKQGLSSAADTLVSRFTVPESDARTLLAGFFSILLCVGFRHIDYEWLAGSN